MKRLAATLGVPVASSTQRPKSSSILMTEEFCRKGMKKIRETDGRKEKNP
jgi:hypothetical protein